MYNMQISIFGVKFTLEILLLIAILYILIGGHLICSCSRVGILEGMDILSQASQTGNTIKEKVAAVTTALAGTTINKPKEGFAGANTNYGESSAYSLSNNKAISTKNWFSPDLVVTPGQPLSKGVQNILNRKPQPIPLPEGELSMFATTPFKPECCPNTYSNSMGCACMTTKQYNYLIERGGNNVPYSEY